MPYYIKKTKCTQTSGKKGNYTVNKKKTKKKKSCHTSKTKAAAAIRATYAEELSEEIKKYFLNKDDEDYMAFNNHSLSSKEYLLDPTKPAPWDHLTNTEDDEDVDIEIEEKIYK